MIVKYAWLPFVDSDLSVQFVMVWMINTMSLPFAPRYRCDGERCAPWRSENWTTTSYAHFQYKGSHSLCTGCLAFNEDTCTRCPDLSLLCCLCRVGGSLWQVFQVRLSSLCSYFCRVGRARSVANISGENCHPCFLIYDYFFLHAETGSSSSLQTLISGSYETTYSWWHATQEDHILTTTHPPPETISSWQHTILLWDNILTTHHPERPHLDNTASWATTSPWQHTIRHLLDNTPSWETTSPWQHTILKDHISLTTHHPERLRLLDNTPSWETHLLDNTQSWETTSWQHTILRDHISLTTHHPERPHFLDIILRDHISLTTHHPDRPHLPDNTQSWEITSPCQHTILREHISLTTHHPERPHLLNIILRDHISLTTHHPERPHLLDNTPSRKTTYPW